jgi:hypothetical protein
VWKLHMCRCATRAWTRSRSRRKVAQGNDLRLQMRLSNEKDVFATPRYVSLHINQLLHLNDNDLLQLCNADTGGRSC